MQHVEQAKECGDDTVNLSMPSHERTTVLAETSGQPLATLFPRGILGR